MMKVWGIFPVFVRKSKDSMGHAKGFFIWLPDDAEEAMVKHELFHVKQFLAFLGIVSLIVFASALFIVFLKENGIQVNDFITYSAGAVIGFISSVVYGMKRVRFRLEAAAYGESLRYITENRRLEVQRHYARALAMGENYDFDRTYEETYSLINQRFKDGKII